MAEASIEIGEVSKNKEDSRCINITPKDSKRTLCFQKRLYDESFKILGEDTSATINDNGKQPKLLVKSSKGYALILGIKND